MEKQLICAFPSDGFGSRRIEKAGKDISIILYLHLIYCLNTLLKGIVERQQAVMFPADTIDYMFIAGEKQGL